MIASDLAEYVTRFYAHLMTATESAAHRYLAAVAKAMTGRSDVEAQDRLRSDASSGVEFPSDPAVLALARNGLGPFLESTAQRILHDNRDKVVLNRCPKCGALTRTPTARLCLSCGHDWHENPSPGRAAV